MASYKFTIGNHISQARHPFTKEPLFDDDGKPVPLFPDQKTLFLDGRPIAFISKGGVRFIVPCAILGTALHDAATEFAQQYTDSESVATVPDMTEVNQEEQDYDD